MLPSCLWLRCPALDAEGFVDLSRGAAGFSSRAGEPSFGIWAFGGATVRSRLAGSVRRTGALVAVRVSPGFLVSLIVVKMCFVLRVGIATF